MGGAVDCVARLETMTKNAEPVSLKLIVLPFEQLEPVVQQLPGVFVQLGVQIVELLHTVQL